MFESNKLFLHRNLNLLKFKSELVAGGCTFSSADDARRISKDPNTGFTRRMDVFGSTTTTTTRQGTSSLREIVTKIDTQKCEICFFKINVKVLTTKKHIRVCS